MDKKEIKQLAEFDFVAGRSVEDIAIKYDVKLNTVKSWRTRGGWQKKKDASNPKNAFKNASKTNAKMHSRNANAKSDAKPLTERESKRADILEEELVNPNLTEKQRAFVKEYLISQNATQAYMNAYSADRETADKVSYRVLGNVGVKAEIERLKPILERDLDLGVKSLLIDLAKEAKADVGKYVNFASHDELIINETTGLPALDKNDNPITRHVSQVWLKDKDEVDTSLIKKVSVGKDGVQLELHDRNKARDELLKRLTPDPATELKLRKLRAEAELAEAKAKLMAGDDNVEDENVKALIEGMRSIANSVNGAANEDD